MREDFAAVGHWCHGMNRIKEYYLNEHCTTRWISLEKVLIKIIQKFSDITCCFHVTVLIQKHLIEKIASVKPRGTSKLERHC